MSNLNTFLNNVDKGLYYQARKEKLTPAAFVAREVQPEPDEVAPVYQRLLKRYKAEDDGGNFSWALRQHAEELAALEKCFEARDIRVRGPYADNVEKFYSSTNDTALFPVFLATEIIAGLLATSLAPRLAALDQRINSHIAEKVTMSEAAADRTLKFTGEGAAMPKTKITTTEGNVTLYKYGRVLEFTYEAARLQSLDVIGLFMQRMGEQMGIDETDDLIEVLIAGDGTSSSAVTDTDAEASGTLDYDELIRLFQAFPSGYNMSDAIINDTNTRTILNMAEFKDPLVQVKFQDRGLNSGQIPILGATFHRWTSTGSTSFSTDRILAVDRRRAVKILREGDLLEEADRIIDQQINQRAMSEWVGYMKLDNNCTQCLDITT